MDSLLLVFRFRFGHEFGGFEVFHNGAGSIVESAMAT